MGVSPSWLPRVDVSRAPWSKCARQAIIINKSEAIAVFVLCDGGVRLPVGPGCRLR